MNLGRALTRGVYSGAQIGLALGLGAMLLTGLPLFEGGFTELLFPNAALNAGALTLAESFSAIVVGAALGGTVSTLGHAIVQTVPGLAYLLGDAPPRSNSRALGDRPSTRSKATHFGETMQGLDETDDRNVGFRRMIEEQRQLEEQRQIGR